MPATTDTRPRRRQGPADHRQTWTFLLLFALAVIIGVSGWALITNLQHTPQSPPHPAPVITVTTSPLSVAASLKPVAASVAGDQVVWKGKICIWRSHTASDAVITCNGTAHTVKQTELVNAESAR